MRKRSSSRARPRAAPIVHAVQLPEAAFDQIVAMIERSRLRAQQVVNSVLVDLYWQIGEFLCQRIRRDGWGMGTINELSAHLQRRQPGIRGFSPSNLWRIRQFAEAWRGRPELAALLRELSWTHHLILLGRSKRQDEQEFYLRRCIEERWSSRELDRRFRQALFERTILHPPKVSAAMTEIHGSAAGSVLKDVYFVEFLDLPAAHTEDELHRALNCQVAVELKVDRFEPEHLGKLEFYLEALDRDHRKPHENPAIGVLLCASKDREVVEYALSRARAAADAEPRSWSRSQRSAPAAPCLR